jgi:hypothetical protein
MGGTGWALAGGAVGNYVLEKTPDDSRPSYLAWHNMALQAGILLGALHCAPALAGWWGLSDWLDLRRCLSLPDWGWRSGERSKERGKP